MKHPWSSLTSAAARGTTLLTKHQQAPRLAPAYSLKRRLSEGSRRFHNYGEGPILGPRLPIRAFSWLKAPTSAFTFKTPLRNNAKWALTPRYVDMKLGRRHKSPKGRAVG